MKPHLTFKGATSLSQVYGLIDRFSSEVKNCFLFQIVFLFFLFNSLSAFQLHPITSYPVVGYKEISFFDESYQQSRTILIWYPVDPKTKGVPSSDLWDVFDIAIEAPIANPKIKKPLIIISHGYDGSPHQLSWLINKLVYNDYIVIGIQHLDIISGQPQINSWKRAQDIHTMLDQFALKPLAKSTNLDQIGLAGYSIGGTTGIWLTGGRSTQLDHFVPGPNDVYSLEFKGVEQGLPFLDKEKTAQEWKDERIKAAFLMAPAWAWIFEKNSLQKITIPTYIVASDADNVLVTSNNAGLFSKHIPNAMYQTIPGQVGHYIFISTPKETNKLQSNHNSLITDALGVNREWIQFEVARNASDFFQSIFSSSQRQKF
jgi:predicted dienelactone hydrolase